MSESTKPKHWVSAADLRRLFLDFFAKRDHRIVDSSSLVPANDPTLLFTNSGMVQFKDVFLGSEKRPYKRATTAQRCVRAGGKHNDLENVGYTARHHTFFEMLGNFSFGDYFKEDAIKYAWEFLTEVLHLPSAKLWVTVYAEDDEAAAIWLNQIGIPPERLTRIPTSDNFWQMGDTGPCGPCSEIFYDHGPDVAGGPPGTPGADGDRYIEIWNLVFMQFEKSADGRMTPLPKPCVDTGMGLERLTAVLQGVHSNYEIDLFQRLMQAIGEFADLDDLNNPSVRVIADHIRSCAFLIADGILPSNDGRGYVLRRIIRRAARHGHKLGLTQTFFHKLVDPLITEMGEAYPILVKTREHIIKTLQQEENRFNETLAKGMKILDERLALLKNTEIPGELIFKLYDTYGFPVDLTGDIARERGLTLDLPGYEKEMETQRKQSQEASQFGVDLSARIQLDQTTEFHGYEHLLRQSTVLALFKDGVQVERLQNGERGSIVLDNTPFYAESGGQVGDRGDLRSANAHFVVEDTQKQGGVFVHSGKVSAGEINVQDSVHAEVDQQRRQATVRNHSATHLLHAALRKVLGPHVQQKGSLVNAERLRFDFSHPQPLSASELIALENLVNAQICANTPAKATEMSMEAALQNGALAFFGDKYGEKVRVLTIGDFSKELCGGTHVNRTGDIGFFKIISEGGIASGVRRIEALTGEKAVRWVHDHEADLRRLSELLKTSFHELPEKVGQLLERNRELEKRLEHFKTQAATQAGDELLNKVQEIAGIKVLAAELPGADAKNLRDNVDRLKNKLGAAAIVLASIEADKVRLVAGVSKALTERLKAGDLVNMVAEKVGGRGGGRADMAQAGGNDPAALSAALAAVPQWVNEQLGL